ncbi:MAG: hypothetical protein RL088_3558 [Verrucomicrobiota bacterium]|jgi:hypothetical protein
MQGCDLAGIAGTFNNNKQPTMTNRKTKLLAATALMLAAQSVIAALPYADGDLILGFHATGGQGATQSYEVNLGNASQFIAGVPATVDVGGNIAADLAAIYGPNWSTRSDVKWGISGVQYTAAGVIPARTVFVSKASPAIGTQSLPWLRVSLSTQNPTVGKIQAASLAYANGNSAAGQVESTNSTKGLTQLNASSPNAYATHMVGGINSNAGSSYLAYINGSLGIENTFGAGSYGTSLDLYRLDPGSVGSPGAFLGAFQLNPAGVLSFSPTGAGLPSAPTVSVSATSLTASETDPKVTVMVVRSGDTATPFTVDVATTAITAVPTQDFTPVSTTVSFASGEVSKLVDVFLIDAPGYQGTRTLNVSLSNPTSQSTLGTNTTTLVTITDDEVPSPVSTVLASKDSPVPNAGVPGSGILAGAVWTTFGVPSINDNGQVAFLASWKTGTVTSTGVFVNGALVVRKGDAVPGLTNVVMTAIKDPLLGPDGSVAWIATLANAPTTTGAVTSADNEAILLDADGAGPAPATVVARKGGIATGAAIWNTFTSVALGGNSVSFTGTLVNKTAGTSPGPGGVTTASDSGLWVFNRTTSTMNLALREGDLLLGHPIKTIFALVGLPGSPGQGRGAESDGTQDFMQVRVLLANNQQALGSIADDGSGSFDYVQTNDAPDYGTGAKWLSFGLPTQNSVSTAATFLGTVKSGTGTATSTNNTAIFSEDDTSYLAAKIVAKGDIAPGATGGVFSVLKDPVSASNRSVAFAATMKTLAGSVSSGDNDGIWWNDPSSALTLVAREGAQPPDAPTGAKWDKFSSLALPEGRGPIFVASMLSKTGTLPPGPGGVTTANDVGLWATSSTGSLRLLMREGDPIGTSTVKSFTVLSMVAGSPAQTRSFNNAGVVVLKVTDMAGAQHLVQIALP